MSFQIPELLAPAGNMAKLKVAFSYGADAVYLGGEKYGLRSAADNFTQEELIQAKSLALLQQKKIYVVLNSFFFNHDFWEFDHYVGFLNELKIDAVIVSDLGAITKIKKQTNIPVHLSTQASCLNAASAKFWRSMGVQRIILGREVSLNEAKKIKQSCGLEIEMFIHGSMCMAYSGHCTISNYTAGRDSNRGGCAHSCRFEYSLKNSEQDENPINSFFMSSKDLNGLDLLEQYAECGIDSVKVEGRMKSQLYVGTVSKVYSEALAELKQDGKLSPKSLENWQQELNKISHRDYTTASLEAPADASSIYHQREHSDQDYVVVGNVLEVSKDQEHAYALLEVKHKFHSGESLEILPFTGQPLSWLVSEIKQLNGETLSVAQPNRVIKICLNHLDHLILDQIRPHNIVRRRLLNERMV